MNSIRRPSRGCVNASRAACRNGRSSRCTARISPGTRRCTPPYSESPTIGMADRAEVHADLVRAAGVDGDLAQRDARQVVRARDARHGVRARAWRAPTSSAGWPGRGRSPRRCGGPPARRPRRARCIPSRPRDRGTAARAPDARRRSWRPPSRRTCRDRAGGRCPGRVSPPMPLRSVDVVQQRVHERAGRMARRRDARPCRPACSAPRGRRPGRGCRAAALRRRPRTATGVRQHRRRPGRPRAPSGCALGVPRAVDASPPRTRDVPVGDQLLDLRSRVALEHATRGSGRAAARRSPAGR